MLNIGCHLPHEGAYLAMAGEALALDATTFQFFLRNPRGGRAREVDPDDVATFKTFAAEHHISPIVGYASYTMNLASPKQEQRDYARMILSEDLARMEETPGQLYVLHCGSSDGMSAETSMVDLAAGLNAAITASQTTKILIMTMAGRGSEIGCTFEQLAIILDHVKQPDHVGVCLDACSMHDAGYDIAGNLDGVLAEFDRTVGLDRVGLVHLNDSRYLLGSHEGRHATIGEGTIGFDALLAMTKHPKLAGLPFIIEEPHGTLEEYKSDIADFRQGFRNAPDKAA